MASSDTSDRQEWPFHEGAPCPVEGCKTPHFSSYHMFEKHWRRCHVIEMNMYQCPLKTCKVTLPERAKVTKHIRRLHKDDEQTLIQNIKTLKRTNCNYKDPGTTKPFKFVRPFRNVAAKEAAAAERRQLREKLGNNFVPFPNHMN